MAQSHRLQEIGEQQAKLQKMQQEQLAKKEVLLLKVQYLSSYLPTFVATSFWTNKNATWRQRSWSCKCESSRYAWHRAMMFVLFYI